MKKGRLEAFSDGVFAIVITLLILDIKLPHVDYAHLYPALISILPNIAVYILSFVLIGMYWMFHHHSFTFIREVDGVLLWMNLMFLLTISFMPFPSRLLGEYPFKTLPVILYGGNLILSNMMGFIMLIYLHKNRQLASELFTNKTYRQQLKLYLIVNALYLLSILLSFFHPVYSCAMFGLTAIILLIRSIIVLGIGKCTVSKQ